MKTFNQFINESIRDKMTPKSEEDILKSLDKLPINDKISKIFLYNLYDKFKEEVDEYLNHYEIEGQLLIGCKNGQYWLVKKSIDQGANINYENGICLLYATIFGHRNIIKLLLKKGIKVTKKLINSIEEHNYGHLTKEVDLVKNYMKTNESVRDLMTPKSISNDDIKRIFKDNSTYHELKKIESTLKEKFGNKITTKFSVSKDEVGPRGYEKYMPELLINPDDRKNHISIGVGGDYESEWGFIVWVNMGYESFKSWNIEGVIKMCTRRISNSLNESIRDKMIGKSRDDINSVKNELNEIYVNEQKVKYKILKYLESIGFNFTYDTERIKNDNFEPELNAIIGTIYIDDFIKEHKKSLPNFNSLSYTEQDKVWDKNMETNIKPTIINILEEFNFGPLKDITYGSGDMKIDFKTPYDDKFAYSKKYPKIVLDGMIKQNTNESIRSKMIPKSKEEIDRIIGQLTPIEKFKKGLWENYEWLMKQAVEEGVTDDEIWKILIESHISNNEKLIFGCLYGFPKIVQRAIDIIPNLTTKLKNDYYYAIDSAIENNNIECVDLLIKINRKYNNLINIKKVAERRGVTDVVKLVDGYLKTNN